MHLRLTPQPLNRPSTQGHTDDDSGSYEYLVYQKVLVAIAAQFDLWPVTEYDDFQLDALLDAPEPSSDGSKLFRRFKAGFTAEHPSIPTASRLNCAFVFVKGRAHAEGARAVLPPRPPTHAPPPEPAGCEDEDGAEDEVTRTARPVSLYKRPSRARKPASNASV